MKVRIKSGCQKNSPNAQRSFFNECRKRIFFPGSVYAKIYRRHPTTTQYHNPPHDWNFLPTLCRDFRQNRWH